jgi:hypothetical protein
MRDTDIFEAIQAVKISRIDQMISDNTELSELMLRNTEFIRLKNLDYFELKRKQDLVKFELETLEAKATLNLNPTLARNAESRKASVFIDPECLAKRRILRELSLDLEQKEQEIWTLRHLESNLRLVAELRIIELKKM